MRSEIAQKMSLATIRYSQVWEDARLLRQGLQVGPGDRVLSIMSAGDNALDVLLAGAEAVVAIDMSPAQLALVELKLAAMRALDHADFVAFWGARAHDARGDLYRDELRAALDEPARAFWDTHPDELAAGPLRCGKLEGYIQGFAREHLPELWGPQRLEALLQAESLEEQRALLDEGAFGEDFEARFRWYFGREMMEKHGRDPQQFAYVEGGDVGRYFYQRFQWVLAHTRVAQNFYLQSFLFAGFPDLECAPAYLTPRGFERLTGEGLLDRLTLELDELERYLGAHPDEFDGANLSDIFEYMSAEDAEAMFASLGRTMRPGGRIAYWNLLVPRAPQAQALEVLTPQPGLSHRLHGQDRSWFYRAFHVDEVTR